MAAATNPQIPGRNVWDFLTALLALVSNLLSEEMGSQTATLARIDSKVSALSIQLQELSTMTQKQFDDVLDVLDTATTKAGTVATSIGDQLTALRAAVTGQGLPAATEQAILDRLTITATAASGLADALTKMATDPGNPVPVPVPDPPPPGPPPTA